MPPDPAARLVEQAERLMAAVTGWPPARWASAPYALPGLAPTAATRAEVMHHLVQRIADLDAAVENQPARRVPRLDDLGLPYQLRVVLHDLVCADPDEDTVGSALAETVLHRAEVDGARGDPVALARSAARCPARAGGARADGARADEAGAD